MMDDERDFKLRNLMKARRNDRFFFYQSVKNEYFNLSSFKIDHFKPQVHDGGQSLAKLGTNPSRVIIWG